MTNRTTTRLTAPRSLAPISLARSIALLSRVLFSMLLPAFASTCEGQFLESFEGASTSWQRRHSDCTIVDSRWDQRRTKAEDGSNGVERIEFQNGAGTQIFVSHDVAPAFVIPELFPSVRIKASRPGIRLLARVVLPRTASPTGDGPMTTMLPGPRYQATDKWETLSFRDNPEDLQKQLREQIWYLRQEFGSHVDGANAYVDKVVLNLYAGPGATQVQIDELKIDGIVAADKIAQEISIAGAVQRDAAVRQASGVQEEDKRQSLVQRDGTVLLVKKAPFFPRIIQHNGESFAYLKALGFNTIELKSTATLAQLKQAQELDVWLISPPPSSVGLTPIGFQYDRILAWSVGENLTARELSVIQQRVREIRESDRRQGRPIIANASANWSRIARATDVLSIGREPIGTSFLASQYSTWIRQRLQAIGNSQPIVADIQTEMSTSLTNQINALATKSPPIPLTPQQLKFLAFEAVAGGARGLRFLSRSRLDGSDPVTLLRALSIEWLNAEVTLIEPWAVGGALMGEVNTGNSEIEVTAINTNRSRLLLVQRPTHHEQYVAGDQPVGPLQFQDTASTFSDSAYLIGDQGLLSLPNTSDHTGRKVQIENCPYSAAVVITQDPLVVNKLNQGFERIGQQSILSMHVRLTEQWVAIMQLINQQMGRMGRSSASASGALNEAINAYRTAKSLIDGNSPQAAVEFLHRADERLAFMQRELMSEPLDLFQSKTSTPFALHSSLIPLLWELAGRTQTAQWNPNGLAGGDFENLDHMMSHGWINRNLDDEQVATKVQLAEDAAIDGRYGLKLTVAPQAGQLSLVEASPLWVVTPQLPVKAGQLVRVHGWVKIDNLIQGSHDGLKITDSLGGEGLAERIPITNGWQEFTLYRGAATASNISVKFELTGVGEAMVDEVTIRTVDLPPAMSRQARN